MIKNRKLIYFLIINILLENKNIIQANNNILEKNKKILKIKKNQNSEKEIVMTKKSIFAITISSLVFVGLIYKLYASKYNKENISTSQTQTITEERYPNGTLKSRTETSIIIKNIKDNKINIITKNLNYNKEDTLSNKTSEDHTSINFIDTNKNTQKEAPISPIIMASNKVNDQSGRQQENKNDLNTIKAENNDIKINTTDTDKNILDTKNNESASIIPNDLESDQKPKTDILSPEII